MTRCYIGLGSNLDDPDKQISLAIDQIGNIQDLELLRSSSRYLSKPIGPVEQPDFINAVIEIETNLPASELLKTILNIEDNMGRERTTVHWGPRNIDLDLLVYGDNIINEVNLTVPHPEISKRNFVLYPLYEINCDLDIPGYGLIKNLIEMSSKDDLSKIV